MASLSLWCYEQDHDETGGHSLESSFAADARAQVLFLELIPTEIEKLGRHKP